MFSLKCASQNYAWGKTGSSSAVYKLLESDGDVNLDQKKPYAELWMGTHPSGPCYITTEDGKSQLLSTYISNNPHCLGDACCKQFSGNLPFLFKVLSVNTALSIQAHPDKSLAEQLHATRPDLYKDPNHKPEMAIALTEFEALVGFRLLNEILEFVHDFPALEKVLGDSNIAMMKSASQENNLSGQKAALHACFQYLMTCSNNLVESTLASISNDIAGRKETLPNHLDLFKRLMQQYPGDVGCLAVFMLNIIKLKPNEAIFLEASLPHAYIEGNCIECMACSDNVVRAGLTPKFKDVDTLCSMLSYLPQNSSDVLFKPSPGTEAYITVYDPPIPDFSVDKIEVPLGSSKQESFNLPAVQSASIILIISGVSALSAQTSSTEISIDTSQATNVVFVVANQTLAVRCLPNEHLLMFRAYTNLLSK